MEEAVWFSNLPIKGSGPGLYVIRNAKNEQLFRFGMTIHCLNSRCAPQIAKESNVTGLGSSLGRFNLIGGWLLKDWPRYRVVMAEQCMFASLAGQGAEPHNKSSHPKQSSIYRLESSFEPKRFKENVEHQLMAIQALGN